MQNPLILLAISAIRHLVVTGLFYLVTILSLPDSVRSQVESAADWTAPIIVAFVVWLVLKAGKPALKKMGYISAFAFTCLSIGCADFTGTVSYRDPSTGAKGGLVFDGADRPTGFVRVPITDSDGNSLGVAEFGAKITPNTNSK